VVYNREASGGIARLVADIRKARELLHFRPRTRLQTGLRTLLATDPIIGRFADVQSDLPADQRDKPAAPIVTPGGPH
jgi:hypothetical protein